MGTKEMIIRTVKAIVLSLLFHILIFLIFFINFKDIKIPPPSKKSKKISLNLSNFTAPSTPKPTPKPTHKPTAMPPKPQVKPKIQQPILTKPIPKKKLIKDEKRTFVKKIETSENNSSKRKKIVKKKKVTKKRITKKELQKQKSNNALVQSLMNSLKPKYSKKRTSPSKRTPSSKGSYGKSMINRLYGKEFNAFSSTQKKFIKNNLGTIHMITQRTLSRNGYPEVAARTRQQGTNIVSFYLHPNGDISKLRLKTPIGYRSLDNNTLEVIRIAYKDYPLPNQKTKIIFYVQYSIY